MKYYFILNPNARTGKGQKIWKDKLLPALRASRRPWKVFYTHFPGHCTQIVEQLTRPGGSPVTIVILGGDGTLNEAVNGIKDFSRVSLGYIPLGSSNDFSRGMEQKGADPAQTLHNILRKKHEVWLDYGVVKAPGTKEQRFIVSSGIGFDAYVTDDALHSPIKNVLNAFHLGKTDLCGHLFKAVIPHPSSKSFHNRGRGKPWILSVSTLLLPTIFPMKAAALNSPQKLPPVMESWIYV